MIEAARTTGVENLELNTFLGDMYLDLNIYDNIYTILENLSSAQSQITQDFFINITSKTQVLLISIGATI